MSRNINESLAEEDLIDIKKKLFLDSTPRNAKNNVTVKKQSSISPYKQTPTNKIKLKHHLKTEFIPITPFGVTQARLKTSPNNKQSTYSYIDQLKISKFEHQSGKKMNTVGDLYSIDEIRKQKNIDRKNTNNTQLMPTNKKSSLSYSNIYRDSFRYSVSKSKEKDELSKSRKKTMFTVFGSKEKTQKKSQSPKKQHIIQYDLPYRYHSSITIDLFDTSKTKHNRSKSKSLNKKVTSYRTQFSRKLMQPQDQRIKKTLEKLQSYRFVFEYMTKFQIIQKLNTYAFKNEPQCKWALLIVDEVFKKDQKQAKNPSFR